jgi:putative ABC transport system permease protein
MFDSSSLLADVRYGFRQLRLNPGFALVTIATLALGIGANTALFSVVRTVILKPLPYRDPERLVRVWMDNRRLQMREDWASYLNYQDYKRLGTSFESIAAFTEPTLNLAGDGEPERIRGVFAEAALFDVLGVKPIAGRLFGREEEAAGKDAVAVLGWGLAQRRFGGIEAVGKTFEVDGRPRFTVIGVMPPGFRFPSPASEFWAPLVVTGTPGRVGYFLQMAARLKPGITPVQAQAQMDVVGAQLEREYPDANQGYGVFVNPLLNHVAGRVRAPLFVLLGAVGLVLLIACVNVAGLFLARAESRGREIVVRSALGAGRRTLMRQLLVEAGALAIVAGAAGVLAAFVGIRALVWLAPPDLPRLDEIALDGVVLAFAAGVTMLTALTFGLWPAWRLSRVSLQDALREGGRGASGTLAAMRARAMLLVAQCALAIMLLAGAGLLLRSLGALRATDAGFRTDGVLTLRVNASRAASPQPPQLRQFYDQLLARVRALPGVTHAAVIGDLFLSDTPNSGTFTLEDRAPFPPAEQIEATISPVSPGFFEAMQVRLVRGRFFDAQLDKDGGPGAIVINESFANRYWPDQDPVGKRMVFGQPGPQNPWRTIVGVAGDMRRRGLHRGARLETFAPATQGVGRSMQLLVPTNGDPLSLVASVRAEIRALDRSAPITAVGTVEALVGESLAIRRFQAWLLALFSGLAVVLAAVGIFGLMAQSVVRRTQEIGVRVALGATPSQVLGLVLRQGLLLAAAGIVVGIAGALMVARALRSMLYGVGAADPVSYAAAAALLLMSVVIATVVPAWRASRVDPTVALREG